MAIPLEWVTYLLVNVVVICWMGWIMAEGVCIKAAEEPERYAVMLSAFSVYVVVARK